MSTLGTRVTRSTTLGLMVLGQGAAVAGQVPSGPGVRSDAHVRVATQGASHVTDLGILDGADSIVPKALNAHGDAAGYVPGDGFHARAFLYTAAGGMLPLLPAGFTDSLAYDITDGGVVAGRAQNGILDGPDARGWLWKDGVFTLMPPFPGTCDGITPTAANDALQVVGMTCPDSFPQDASFWSAETGYVDLSDLSEVGRAHAINASGVVTGGSNGGAVRWSLVAGLESLGTLAPPYEEHAFGNAINDAGLVTGYSVQVKTGPDSWRALLIGP